jgi:hypothetical protein
MGINYYKPYIKDNSLERFLKQILNYLQKHVAGMSHVGSPDNPPLRWDYAPMIILPKKACNNIPTDERNEGF